jgi:hypothetical protein
MMLSMGHRRILGRFYSLGGTASALQINFFVSLGRVEDFTMIWHKNLDVGFLCNFMYVAGSNRLHNFSLYPSVPICGKDQDVLIGVKLFQALLLMLLNAAFLRLVS